MCNSSEISSKPPCEMSFLIKAKLHEYVVNCLISAGYEDLEVVCSIASMDTSETEGNSISTIENFIQRKYANCTKHNPFPSSPFEFPPGHRIRICNFVKEVKKLREANVKRVGQDERKRSKSACNVVSKKKCEEATSEEWNAVTAAEVSKQVRKCLQKWICKQIQEQDSDYLGKLREGEHCALQLLQKNTLGEFSVSIRCLS